MAKPTNRSNLKVRPSLSALFATCLDDLARYIPPDDLSALQLIDTLDGKLAYVSSRLSRTDVFDNYLTYSAYRQLEALFKKNVDRPGSTALDRKRVALDLFLAAENRCKITNRRLSYFSKYPSRMRKSIREVLTLAQSISHDIFGPMTRLVFQDILDRSGFGPGTTFSSSGLDGHHLYYKVGGPHSVTAEALPYIKVLLNHWPAWKDSLVANGATFDIVNGNRVAFVPKDSATNRTIAVEPSLNVFIQKGVDNYLKGRLRRVGVSLTNQDRNQRIAQLASRGSINASTLDLSQASDSISIEIVRWLVPPLWFVLLDDLRSHEYTLDKGATFHEYQKFSSMGNAFTFPLETIIYYSLAKACTILSGGDLSVLRVYGDDIIIDPRAALLLCEALKFTGFMVNTEKSFFFGNFRETCGADYLSGRDARPVYVKNLPSNDQQVYNLFNRLLRNRVGFQFHNLCEYLHSLVDKPFYGPPDLGPNVDSSDWYAGKSVIFDHYFHAPSSVGYRFKRYDKLTQNSYYHIQLLRFKPKRMDTSNWVLQYHYLAFLYGMSGSDYVESLSRFRRTLPYESFIRWDDPPWRPAFFDCVALAG